MTKTKLQPYINFIKKPLVLFLIFTIVGAIIFYLRFPNNFIEPNFYAEDGSIFLKNIMEKGFFEALFTSFNGYFIIGLYLMEGFAFVINFITQREFIDLASSFAIASYIFLGAVAALPFLLFRKHFNFLALLIVFILVAFVPLPGSDYAVIGTIGNAKFIFVYIAFLLLVYRHLTPEKKWKRIIVVDIFIALCAYTNIVVYPLLLFALIRYIPYVQKKGFWSIFKLRSFQSLLALGLILIPQLIYIKLFGLPAMPGYLDTPYQAASTINLFIYRPFLFPFLSTIKGLNDILVIIAFLIFATGLWLILKKWRSIVTFAVISIFIITLLFVANRTGVSELFLSYTSSGPDQFFYTQNMIICFIVGIALFELINKIPFVLTRRFIWLGLAVILWTSYIPASGTFGANDFMEKTVGNIYINAKEECSEKDAINIQLYPVQSDSFQLKNQDRKKVCTNEVIHYVPNADDLNLTNDSTYFNLVDGYPIQQTFTSNYDRLNGIGIQFLTYKAKIDDNYKLEVYENTCNSSPIRTSRIKGSDIQDSHYGRFTFEPIQHSSNVHFCYRINAVEKENKPLAISLSKADEYKEGLLTLHGNPQEKDIMMELYYAR